MSTCLQPPWQGTVLEHVFLIRKVRGGQRGSKIKQKGRNGEASWRETKITGSKEEATKEQKGSDWKPTYKFPYCGAPREQRPGWFPREGVF